MEIEMVEIKFDGTKEMHEIGLGIKSIIASYKEAVKDGWQIGQDIPTILMGSYQDLLVAIKDAEKSGAEIKAEPVKAVMGAMVPLAEGVDLLIKSEE